MASNTRDLKRFIHAKRYAPRKWDGAFQSRFSGLKRIVLKMGYATSNPEKKGAQPVYNLQICIKPASAKKRTRVWFFFPPVHNSTKNEEEASFSCYCSPFIWNLLSCRFSVSSPSPLPYLLFCLLLPMNRGGGKVAQTFLQCRWNCPQTKLHIWSWLYVSVCLFVLGGGLVPPPQEQQLKASFINWISPQKPT